MEKFSPGYYVSQNTYKSFQPNAINRQWQIANPEIITLLSQADRQLGRLDMFSNYIPSIDLFISMHILKEATKSSRIEGTQTNIEEALHDAKDIPPEKRDDWNEVQNYILAMQEAIESLKSIPLSTRLIKQTHKVLLQGVRGEHKQPGDFRKSQNWIGGASIQDAVFVPPVHTSVPELMSDLEKFMHNDGLQIPELIKIAILHYQFETIHPFLDGNGRIGRLLITLYLVQKEILKKPILYLSDFLEKNRQLYYDNLIRVREKNDLQQWIKFFLVGVVETAKNSIDTFEKILLLKSEVENLALSKGSRAGAIQMVLEHLYKKPVITASIVSSITKQSLATSYSIVSDMEELGILKENTGGKRNRSYIFINYINLYR
jgi:Fic family protein